MSLTPTTVDHHEPTCAALERSTPVLTAAIRRAPADVRPRKMRWTNAEIAAHMYASVVESEKAVRGEPSVYDGTGPTAELDEQMVASVAERDIVVLADLVEQATASYLRSARQRPGDQPVAIPRGTVGSSTGLLALDHHLHGGQFAAAAGIPWDGAVADMFAPLSAVLPYAYDPEAGRGLSASYTLQLTGVAPVRYAIDDGVLRCDLPGPTDCTMTADPQTFLLMGIGVVSQLRATLTGKVRAGGRKPWLAMRVTKLFPPIPHGGVA